MVFKQYSTRNRLKSLNPCCFLFKQPSSWGLKLKYLFILMWKYGTSNFLFFNVHFPSSGFFRQAWALVSVVGGGNTSCSEDVREHENLNTGGRALARCNFTTVDGAGFFVTAYSEWKNGETQLMRMNKFSTKSMWSRNIVMIFVSVSFCVDKMYRLLWNYFLKLFKNKK